MPEGGAFTAVTRTPLLVLVVFVLSSCSPGSGRIDARIRSEALWAGFGGQSPRFELSGNRYWTAAMEGSRLLVQNSELGTGVSPVWLASFLPDDFEVTIMASLVKEGLDGGWGIEFGAQQRKHAYRVLLYGSGRFCVDRLFGRYPEFIHCVPLEKSVVTGESRNALAVRIKGDRISVSVNGAEVVQFRDDRYLPGEFALAVSGAGTRVRFEDIVIRR